MVLRKISCPRCGGRGFLPVMGKWHRCEKCGGRGWILEDD